MTRLAFLPDTAARLRRGAAPVIVTGAGGWLGMAVLEMLESVFGDGLPDRVTAFTASARGLTLRSGRCVAARDYAILETMRSAPAMIFHFAFLTRGHAGQENYAAVNRDITRIMQGFITRNGAGGLVLPSSGAAYRQEPYGILKRADEDVFGALAARNFPAAIVRVFNLAGPYINNLDSYALACIIADVLAGGPVRLRAAHPVWRAYAHVADVLNIATALVLRGASLPVFDTGSETPVEIGELAGQASRLLAGRDLPIIRPDWQGGAPDRYVGDFAAYRNAASLVGVTLCGLEQQILDTAAYLKMAGTGA